MGAVLPSALLRQMFASRNRLRNSRAALSVSHEDLLTAAALLTADKQCPARCAICHISDQMFQESRTVRNMRSRPLEMAKHEIARTAQLAIERTKTGMIIIYVSQYIQNPLSHHRIPLSQQSRHHATQQIARARVRLVFAKENHRFLLRQQPLSRCQASSRAHAANSTPLCQRHAMLIPSRVDCAVALRHRSIDRHGAFALEPENARSVGFELSLRERVNCAPELPSLGNGAF